MIRINVKAQNKLREYDNKILDNKIILFYKNTISI